jgi:MGT family glycosyltransferase
VAYLLAATDRVRALVPPGFDSPVTLPENTAYVGPITYPRSGRRIGEPRASDLEMITRPGDPWVLLSLSTTLQRQGEALPAMLAAVESLPLRVLLTLGGVVPADSVSAPPNVTVRDFVPHDVVLPHMAAVVCHGGLSTITSALAAGVPLVCIPQGRDQHFNAARVAACGVGQVVAPEAPPAEIANAVQTVVDDAMARKAARRFAEAVSALGGGESATAEVEQLAGSMITSHPGEDHNAVHR